MNRANNERYQTTERKIIDTFVQLLEKKELSEITVSEICHLSGIHRTSFYLHFQDVYELMSRVEEYLAAYYANIFEAPEEKYALNQRFQRLFTFIHEHQNFYRAYWAHSNDLRILDASLSPKAADGIKLEAERSGFQSETELEYHRIFFKAGLAALIGYWLSRRCKETPAELSEIIGREYRNRNRS